MHSSAIPNTLMAGIHEHKFLRRLDFKLYATSAVSDKVGA